jgi:methylthioribose-1-phosphate isomerase
MRPDAATSSAGDASATPATPPTLAWQGDAASGHLRLIDQTRLPTRLEWLDCRDEPTVWEAIKVLRVRGAPAIGAAAAYGAVLGARACGTEDRATVLTSLAQATASLRTSRPTAVNLFWALDRLDRAAAQTSPALSGPETLDALLAEAHQIAQDDRDLCRALGRHGAPLLSDGQGVLTHCNAGALATVDYGTALAVIFAAVETGKQVHVYADETRPLLQGARLTAWELARRGIPVTLICDNMAAQVMREGRVSSVIVGADRIASNGDTANKIGTYGVALLAHAHGIPFYVAAPSSTFDLSLADGSGIPIEQRDAREVTHGFGPPIAPAEGVAVYNPAFDVTPAHLIAGIITERGVIAAPLTADAIRGIVRP